MYRLKANKSLILASGSPRRQEFFNRLGLSFQVIAPDVVEDMIPGEDPEQTVKRLAQRKAEAVSVSHGAAILAADTIVVLNREILGKPTDQQQARETLQLLSGQTHEVITGWCLRLADFCLVQTCRSQVTFRPLSLNEIKAYAQSGEPFDKAGAYAIQGLAAGFVKQVAGSYSNIVGLPLSDVLEALLAYGIIEADY